ncbi:histidine-type phosphatase [Succinatimonas hippei]|uniref:histidine-type phosphatase n=1 Tax=Succinatimonas hippei TaxID=626938 RepID=UPI0025A378A7|nr:histidine-type phosphatase [Succinatimonas hippei]MDM8120372.1 histidine-type phosphatase [Succinatimonas hippei]
MKILKKLYAAFSLIIISSLFNIVAAENFFNKFAPCTDAKLEKIVVLSRHGVRSPTQDDKTLNSWSNKYWQQWGVPLGHLTDRGYFLIKSQWQDLKEILIKDSFYNENLSGTLKIIADSDQRTIQTAEAIKEAFSSDTIIFSEKEKVYPLFHPVKAGIVKINVQDVKETIIDRINTIKQQEAINLIQTVTNCCSQSICNKNDLCNLSTIRDSVTIKDNDVKLLGEKAIASSIAEIFLLEYGQWPDRNAGWGQIDEKSLSKLLALHNEVFDALNREKTVALGRGGVLLEALKNEINNGSSRITFFVGHDTNISNVGGLTDLTWNIPLQGVNSIPPGCALVFLRWNSESENNQYITVAVAAPSMKFLHSKNPDKKDLFLVSANLNCRGKICTLSKFNKKVDRALKQ